MRVGAFEISEPVPELRQPHAIAMLRPWIDVGSVGSLTLAWLENRLFGRPIGRLVKPGSFFDFTRYRPTIRRQQDKMQVTLPNSIVTCATGLKDEDFLFLHLLEPHMLGEEYVDGVMRLLKTFGVKRYCLIGAMYDMVPHTRPTLVSGRATGDSAVLDLKRTGCLASEYEGPTTITYLITQLGAEVNMETMSMIVHLPQYSELDEDYTGCVRLMEIFELLYGVPVDDSAILHAEEQHRQMDAALENNPQLKYIVAQLEEHYDTQRADKPQESAPLAPELEKFLREMEGKFGQG